MLEICLRKTKMTKYKKNEFEFLKDDQTWKWDVDNELHLVDIRQMGYDCQSATIMLENLVTEEYCTYITSKFEKYDIILRALKEQFHHLSCQGGLYMKCNDSVQPFLNPLIFVLILFIRKLFQF